MTDNQQKIIDSLIAEFNSRNERTTKGRFNLVNIDEIDSINQLHLELVKDSERSKQLWESQRAEYIKELITTLREDIGDRLCVERGDIANDNINYSDSIFIYKHDTRPGNRWEQALRFNVRLVFNEVRNDITKDFYKMYHNIELTRYVTGNRLEVYNNEDEFFKCEWTKDKLKDLLS